MGIGLEPSNPVTAKISFTATLASNLRHTHALIPLAFCFMHERNTRNTVQSVEPLRPPTRIGLAAKLAVGSMTMPSRPISRSGVLRRFAGGSGALRSHEGFKQSEHERQQVPLETLETSSHPCATITSMSKLVSHRHKLPSHLNFCISNMGNQCMRFAMPHITKVQPRVFHNTAI